LINLKESSWPVYLATAVSESTETIEEEPFLIQEGFIMRTPRGREVTDKAYRHLGKVNSTFKVVCFKFISLFLI
jgi:Holliday junction resolvasome RuvABC ATP-dependent DNA helicase subunit